jgi:thiol-disulfide isomerase/thioredoxin
VKKTHLFFFLFLFFLLLHCGGSPDLGNPNHGFDFSLPDLKGTLHNFADYRGSVLVLNFWATWCPPCKEEMPKLNGLFEKYENLGVQVVGIALDKDSLDLVSPFVTENGIKYTVLLGDQQVLGRLKNFKGMPTTVVFDQKGEIRRKFDGSLDAEELEEMLQLLLED